MKKEFTMKIKLFYSLYTTLFLFMHLIASEPKESFSHHHTLLPEKNNKSTPKHRKIIAASKPNLTKKATLLLEKSISENPADFARLTMRGYLAKYAESRTIYKQVGESRTSIFHRSFFKKYIEEVYNDPKYTLILSQNSNYILEFLDLSNEFPLSCEDVYAVLRLFNIKLKECEVIDDDVLRQFMPHFPSLIKRHFKIKKKNRDLLNQIKKNIELLILNKFTHESSLLEQEPEVFVSELSTSLAKLVLSAQNNNAQALQDHSQEYQQEKLRQMIVSLFQTMIERTLWNAKSYESIIDSFIGIGDGIISLGTKGILSDMDDLDLLLWSLNHRFIYFLDVFGGSLPLEFYEHLEAVLDNGEIFFLELAEQDTGIKTKRQFLTEAIVRAKIKALAQEKGIIC